MATIYAVYYALRVVGNERGEGDLWWGRAISTSMVIVAVTAPFLGSLADRTRLRRSLFIGFTVLSVAATGLMATVEPGMIVWGLLLAVAGTVGYESALVYYNAWLAQLAPRGREGRLSAWGFAVGYAGSIVALLIALPLVRGGAFDRTFLATATLFGVFAVPAFIFLPAPPGVPIPVVPALRDGLAELVRGLRTIVAHRQLRRFFAAYFFYEDGVITVIAFSAIFAAQTLAFPMDRLIVLYVVVQVSALLGALAWSWPIDRLGAKRVVLIMLAQWIAVVVAAYFVETQAQFFAVAVIAGTGLGAIQAASRTLLARLAPGGKEAQMFGFYALCGKSAAIMGPVVFGTISHASGGNQRLGALAIGAFFVVGAVLLAPMREPIATNDAAA